MPLKKTKRVTWKQAQKLIKQQNYKDRIKAMRPYFGDLFKPKNGYDLRRFDQWTRQQKARITKYWQVIAPQVARSHKARYYSIGS